MACHPDQPLTPEQEARQEMRFKCLRIALEAGADNPVEAAKAIEEYVIGASLSVRCE